MPPKTLAFCQWYSDGTYQRFGGIKVDFFDANKKIIHEIKKSNKIDVAHEWQLKYYIYIFEKAGIDGVSGILEYPKLRETKDVFLSDIDRERLVEIEYEIDNLISNEGCPAKLESGICKSCSYYEFCYVQE